MPTLSIEVAVLREKYDNLEKMHEKLEESFDRELKERISELELDFNSRIEKLEEANNDLTTMANRWKGGFAAIVALGSLVGYLASKYDTLKGFFVKFGGS